MARTKTRATYIIYYTSGVDGWSDGYNAFGIDDLRAAMKWLHSDEVKATDITIYKEGPNFEQDQDDVIEVYKQWWK